MAAHRSQVKLRRRPYEVKRARSHVRAFCERMPGEVASTAELLTSELVTNALQHGEGTIYLVVAAHDSHVQVGVSDESSEPPVLNRADPGQTGGRGLAVLDAFANDWGVSPAEDGTGKTVWFTTRIPA